MTTERTAAYCVEYEEPGNFGYVEADLLEQVGVEEAWARQGHDPADIISVGDEPLYVIGPNTYGDWAGYDIRGE